jgi:hypothetical protein
LDWPLKMVPIGFDEASVTKNPRCVTCQKREYPI